MFENEEESDTKQKLKILLNLFKESYPEFSDFFEEDNSIDLLKFLNSDNNLNKNINPKIKNVLKNIIKIKKQEFTDEEHNLFKSVKKMILHYFYLNLKNMLKII